MTQEIDPDVESWDAFAAGDFAGVTGDDPPPVEDDEWRKKNPLHHVADMFVHRYAVVKGRSCPAEFWWGTLVFLVGTSAVAQTADRYPAGNLVFIGWLIIGSIALITAAIRRLHDSGRSGARLLFWLLPFGPVYVIYMLSAGGDLQRNDYGPSRLKHVGAVGKKLYRRAD